MMRTGKIVQWKDDKGFGFIETTEGKEHLFFHHTAFENHQQRPQVGLAIEFVRGCDAKGRPCALRVRRQHDKEPKAAAPRPPSRKGTDSALFAVLLSSAAIALVLPLTHSLKLFAAYLVMSLFSFIAYNLDKAKAEKGLWRTQENTLLMIDLFCGWPGGLVAQHLFHHKNRKANYQAGFWLITLLNIAVVAYFQHGKLALN